MSGKIEIETIAILFFSVTAAGMDLAYGRIFNWFTVSMGALGLVYAVFSGGLHGLGAALLGILAGFVLYSWLFMLGVLGGGDVKLLMALGAWGGAHFALDVATLGIAIGGVMGLGLMLVTGKIRSFAARLYRFILTLTVKELEAETFKIDRKTKMPFGLPIAIAAVWVRFKGPIW